MQTAVVCALVAGMSACGGGGGGGVDGQEPAQRIDLTAANMNAAARAAAAVPYAFGATGIVVASDGPAVSGPVVSGVLGSVRAGRMRALGGFERPLAVYSEQGDCPYGGTLTLGLDDRNANDEFDPGDAMTFEFRQCKSTPHAVLDGSIAVELLRIDPSGFLGRMTMTQVSQRMANDRHATTVDGTALMEYSEDNGAWPRLSLTAEGTMQIDVSTHHHSDSITLQNGYHHRSAYDPLQLMTMTTFEGDITSRAAGGMMGVQTNSPFMAADSDAYPKSGSVLVTGKRGVMGITVVSPSDVRVDLDDNDCGVNEHSQTHTWDEMF